MRESIAPRNIVLSWHQAIRTAAVSLSPTLRRSHSHVLTHSHTQMNAGQGMSMISMLAMEFAENGVELALTGTTPYPHNTFHFASTRACVDTSARIETVKPQVVWLILAHLSSGVASAWPPAVASWLRIHITTICFGDLVRAAIEPPIFNNKL